MGRRNQEELALRINCGPHPVGGPREPRNSLGFTDVTLSHRTEHGVEFIELASPKNRRNNATGAIISPILRGSLYRRVVAFDASDA